jgi:hypothetical protein
MAGEGKGTQIEVGLVRLSRRLQISRVHQENNSRTSIQRGTNAASSSLENTLSFHREGTGGNHAA